MAANMPDAPDQSRKKGSLLRTLKAVAWGFFGVRKNSDYQEDIARLTPLHIVAVGLVAVAVADTPVAIDLESLTPLRERDVPLGSLAPAERAWLADQPDVPEAFARLWVRKEVLVKLGALALDEVGGVDVTPSFDGSPVLGHELLAVAAGTHDAVAAVGAGH